MGNKLNHLGVIMDGNRRWAKKNLLPSIQGHKQGANNLFSLCDWCKVHNIKYLSVYVFSTYNWNRTEEEKINLFELMLDVLDAKISKCIQNKVKVKIMGDYSKLGKKYADKLELLQSKTNMNSELYLNMAINYGGREEIIKAIKQLYKRDDSDSIIQKLNTNNFGEFLYTNTMPDIDLLIRTGGFQRTSNFMIWQAACSELYFTKVLWPDFSYSDFLKAMDFYKNTIINNGK